MFSTEECDLGHSLSVGVVITCLCPEKVWLCRALPAYHHLVLLVFLCMETEPASPESESVLMFYSFYLCKIYEFGLQVILNMGF